MTHRRSVYDASACIKAKESGGCNQFGPVMAHILCGAERNRAPPGPTRYLHLLRLPQAQVSGPMPSFGMESGIKFTSKADRQVAAALVHGNHFYATLDPDGGQDRLNDFVRDKAYVAYCLGQVHMLKETDPSLYEELRTKGEELETKLGTVNVVSECPKMCFAATIPEEECLKGSGRPRGTNVSDMDRDSVIKKLNEYLGYDVHHRGVKTSDLKKQLQNVEAGVWSVLRKCKKRRFWEM